MKKILLTLLLLPLLAGCGNQVIEPIVDEIPLGADSGFTASTAQGTGDNSSWVNPSYAITINGSVAQLWSQGSSLWLAMGEFGLSIPEGATIDGIELKAKAKLYGSSQDTPVRLSWNDESSWTETRSYEFSTTGLEEYTFGSPTDTWGREWSSSDFANNDFVVAIRSRSDTVGQLDVDGMEVKIYYTEGGDSTGSYMMMSSE